VADEVDEAPGWDSIEVAFSDAYPGVEPLRYAPGPPVSLGGIVDGISAYETPKGWHLVTFGLTELFAKGSDEAQLSGWGYELTLRTPVADAPQGWALELLLAVARVTQHRGVVFGEGHRLDVGSSIGGDRSPLRAVAFIRDRATQPRLFPFGHYALLQMVGITFSELQKMKASSTEGVLRRLAEQDPELRTDPARGA
jgi:suppressor of fused-like protein